MPTKGLAAEQQERTERAAQSGGGGKKNWIREVRLTGPGETARMRVLTEGDGFLSAWYHRVQDVLASGATVWRRRLCPQEIGSRCATCEEYVAATPEDRKHLPNRSRQFLAWAFVRFIDYPEAPASDKIETQLVKNDQGVVVNRQTVDSVRLIAMSVSHLDPFVFRFDRNKTLLDRDFEMVRQGARGIQKPTYLLEPLDPSPMTAELKDIMAGLPSLEDVMYGRVSDLGGTVEEAPADNQAESVPVDTSAASFDEPVAAEPVAEAPEPVTDPDDDTADPDPEF
jgi:hypothetical protein